MMRKLGYVTVILLVVLLLVMIVAMAQQPAAIHGAPHQVSYSHGTTYTYNTVITVTSGTDPDTHMSYTCYTGSVAPDGKCTLRRAIVESRNLSGGQLPVLISFSIPQDAGEGYDSSLGVWKIEPKAPSDLSVYRYIKGQVIIDGDTQPGGRTTGPKIILIGPQTAKDGLKVGETAGDDNVIIRGLAFQNFKTHIYVNTDNNLIEDCWFGLSDDGTTLTSGDDTDPEGGSAVSLQASADGNVIRDNVFAGFYGVAAAIRGDNNTFSGNLVGTRADGTVPIPFQFDKHPCLVGAWNGGSGITVEGDDHQIGGPAAADGNIFAGLFLGAFPASTQRPAMDVGGTGHLIQNNVVGLDIDDNVVGVCGQGLDLGNDPKDLQVLDNTIIESALSGIFLNGPLVNGNTLRGNIVKRESQWPSEQGFNDYPENAIAFGKSVPDALRNFEPARIIEVDGQDVTGTAGDGSPCPFCTVEVFLDDTDDVTETLQSLALETADANGSWTANLPAALEPGQGLRTMSTVPDNFTISGLHEGTTSSLSLLQGAAYQVFLPVVQKSRD